MPERCEALNSRTARPDISLWPRKGLFEARAVAPLPLILVLTTADFALINAMVVRLDVLQLPLLNLGRRVMSFGKILSAAAISVMGVSGAVAQPPPSYTGPPPAPPQEFQQQCMCKVKLDTQGYALGVFTDFGSRHPMVDALQNGDNITRVRVGRQPDEQGWDKVETELTRRQGLNASWALHNNLDCPSIPACSR